MSSPPTVTLWGRNLMVSGWSLTWQTCFVSCMNILPLLRAHIDQRRPCPWHCTGNWHYYIISLLTTKLYRTAILQCGATVQYRVVHCTVNTVQYRGVHCTVNTVQYRVVHCTVNTVQYRVVHCTVNTARRSAVLAIWWYSGGHGQGCITITHLHLGNTISSLQNWKMYSDNSGKVLSWPLHGSVPHRKKSNLRLNKTIATTS